MTSPEEKEDCKFLGEDAKTRNKRSSLHNRRDKEALRLCIHYIQGYCIVVAINWHEDRRIIPA